MKIIKNNKFITKIKFQKTLTFVNTVYLWLKSKENIKIQSYQKYESLILIYIVPFFKEKLISKLTNNDIDLFLKSIQEKISVSMQKTIIYIIKATLNYAYKNKWCNHIEYININFKKENKLIYTLTIEEQKRLEESLRKGVNIRKCCLLLCLYTGLRIGEVCGLKWEDINFEGKTMQIKRTIQRIKSNNNYDNKTVLIASTPKSSTSNRIVPIPDFLIDLLKRFQKNNDFYLLSNSDKLYDPRLLEFFYKRILEKSNINYKKFHTLRHTFATRAIESKMDVKTLSEILGHSSIDITLKLYVHPSLELKKCSIEKLADYMINA